MQRKEFVQSLIGMLAMNTLNDLSVFTTQLNKQEEKMPVLFLGHGSPMNAIEDNEYSRGWKNIATTFAKPKAILCISAHWETKGTFVTAMPNPRTIHDFGGFPKALHEVEYKAKGSEWLANETAKTVTNTAIGLDTSWGLDHGSWSVLKPMYPLADVPIIEMSLDYTKPAAYHFALAKQLQSLRQKGVLIIGSGNMVHNFQYADFASTTGADWAIEANQEFKKLIVENNVEPLINYEKHSKAFALSAPTPEHYLPMLYALALQEKKENVLFFNDAIAMQSFSMTSFKIG